MRVKLKNNKMTRIQFELTEQGVQEFEKLMEATNVATRKDLLNNALTLLEWAIKERQKGELLPLSMKETRNTKRSRCRFFRRLPKAR